MTEFKEVWVVDSEDEVNQLLSVGWKFIQVVYKTRRTTDVGWFSAKQRAIGKDAQYLMGRSNGIPARNQEEYETIEDYLEKIAKKG